MAGSGGSDGVVSTLSLLLAQVLGMLASSCRWLLFFLNLFIYLFIYLWLHWVLIAVRGLSLVVASRDYSSLQCVGFSLWWLLLLQSMGSRHAGFSSCGSRDRKSVV